MAFVFCVYFLVYSFMKFLKVVYCTLDVDYLEIFKSVLYHHTDNILCFFGMDIIAMQQKLYYLLIGN